MTDHWDMLKDELLKVVPVVDLIKQDYPSWSGDQDHLLPCPMAGERHEDGDDSSPSLSVHPETGEFVCFGCGWKGTSVIGYYTDVHCNGIEEPKYGFKRALAQLYSRYISPIVGKREILEFRQALTRKPRLMRRITAMRGWTKDTMETLKIGWSATRKRTVLPIFNLAGLCLDLRFHDSVKLAPLHRKTSKRVPMMARKDIGRTGDWFPVNPNVNPFDVRHNEIWLLEGEPDAILAFQEGLNCVTVTGGVKAWKALDRDRFKLLKGKDVIICFDNDRAGQETALSVAKNLIPVGIRSLKNFVLPEGNDITEFFLVHGGDANQMRQISRTLDYKIRPKIMHSQTVHLSETSKPDFIGKHVTTNVLVNGKHHAPFTIPKTVKFSCVGERCETCPCTQNGFEELPILSDDPNILQWLRVNDYSKMVKSEFNMASRCRVNVQIDEWQTLEKISMIPALSDKKSEDEQNYVMREGYYLGHGLEGNQSYTIKALPTTHPTTKESVLLVEEASGSYDSINKFQLTPKEVSRLQELFDGEPKDIINSISDMLAYNHTKIYGRRDLHAAVDLAFHTPSSFSFLGTTLPKGSLELLLLGDTRCGKGQVAEGMVRFYDLGEVISGENASFMGLCGGATKIGNSFQLTWGAIPLNHGRLVVIDEFSGLASDTLGRLSRVRSEGKAELHKGGISATTHANARLIWIANPKKGKEMNHFSNGITAIMELVGTNEDVARFDLAVVVHKGEVDVKDINRLHHRRVSVSYTRDDLRKIVLWVWSRKPDQVVFTRQANEAILSAANYMAERYSPTVPLIQGENVRFKIAKLSAAIAGRCFSTDRSGTLLRITEKHVRLAVAFFKHFYDKPGMGYLSYSAVEAGTNKIQDVKELNTFFKQWPAHIREILIDGLLTVDKFGVREVQDWLDVEATIAKKFIGLFVRCQACRQGTMGLYTKKPAFIRFLKHQKRRLKDA